MLIKMTGVDDDTEKIYNKVYSYIQSDIHLLINEYGIHEDDVDYFLNKNPSTLHTVNKIVSDITEEYIAFLDDDIDFLDEDMHVDYDEVYDSIREPEMNEILYNEIGNHFIKIDIVGEGDVGDAIKKLKSRGSIAVRVRKDYGESISYMEHNYEPDIIFICEPTPINQDGSCVIKNVVDKIKNSGYEGHIVIGSKVNIETIDLLGVYHMPEFLTETNTQLDFIIGNPYNTTQRNSDIQNLNYEKIDDFMKKIYKLFELAYLNNCINENTYSALKVHLIPNNKYELVKRWEQYFIICRDYRAQGHTIQQKTVIDGWKAGIWEQTQRQNYKKGKLSDDKIQKLESMAGWVWVLQKRS